MQRAMQTDVRLAKRLGLNQRSRFSNLGLNYRGTTLSGGVAEAAFTETGALRDRL